jgi:hypothetical protein
MDLGIIDKDMIVMYHKFGYELNGEKKQIDSKMVWQAMIKRTLRCLGLPVAMAALQILNGKISGRTITDKRSVFANIKELEEYGLFLKNNLCLILAISQIDFSLV